MTVMLLFLFHCLHNNGERERKTLIKVIAAKGRSLGMHGRSRGKRKTTVIEKQTNTGEC